MCAQFFFFFPDRSTFAHRAARRRDESNSRAMMPMPQMMPIMPLDQGSDLSLRCEQCAVNAFDAIAKRFCCDPWNFPNLYLVPKISKLAKVLVGLMKQSSTRQLFLVLSSLFYPQVTMLNASANRIQCLKTYVL